jgi:hypothetical protein
MESGERKRCGGEESGLKEFLVEEWSVERGCSLLILILENAGFLYDIFLRLL